MAAVDKMSFVVLDAAGRQVGQGETDSAALELTPGEYTVVVRASPDKLTADHVVVTARGESVVKVVIDGDRFRLRR
jgi:hypothetical protein